MHAWTVLISDGLDEIGQAILCAAARVEERMDITPPELLEAVVSCDALIVRSRTRVTAEVLAASPRLKVVGGPAWVWITSTWKRRLRAV